MSTSVYEEMFEYLSKPDNPQTAEPVLVFGRHDELLAQAMGRIVTSNLASDFVISGGFGKDSGELWEERIPESAYVANSAVHTYQVPPDRIHLEQRALIGTEGARFGAQKMHELKLLGDRRLTVLAHATSLRRLAASVTRQSVRIGLDVSAVHRIPTEYPFDPTSTLDQREAASELLCLADWGIQGHLERPTDLPPDLVAFARTILTAPKHPSSWQLAILRKLPHNVKHRIIARETTAAG